MQVGIIGCGYVGLALAQKLLENGHEVVGARRSQSGLESIAATGATPIAVDLTDPDTFRALPAVDVIIITASTTGLDATASRVLLVDGVTALLDAFGNREQVPDRAILTSTTGVYGQQNGEWVDEQTPVAPASSKLTAYVEAEHAFRESATSHNIEPIVARLGGIYGPGRYRIDSYVSRPVYPGYRNLIHRADAAGALACFVEEGTMDHETVLVVDNEPVDRITFVKWLADQMGTEMPPEKSRQELREDTDRSAASKRRLLESKRCDNTLLRTIGYEFQYPTFRDGYEAAIAARKYSL